MIIGNKKNIFKTWFKIISRIILVIFLTVLILFAYIRFFELPSDTSLRNPVIKEASVLLDTKGRPIGIYQDEYRSPVTYEQINPFIIKCLVAVEDARFYEHGGVDFRALFRVFFKTILLNDTDSGGGSTITQQLAKQFYPRPVTKDKNVFIRSFTLIKSKIKEWMVAWKLEGIYSKEEILTMYLNKFEFVNGAHGIDAAAKTYFSKAQDSLSNDESATLVGMLQNPSRYNPIRFPDLVHQRRNEVLLKTDKKEYEKLKSVNTDFSNFKRFSTQDTIVPYFKNSLETYLSKLIREQKITKPDGTFYNIFNDGLIIESTIDLDLQKYAEKATLEHMAWIQTWFDLDWKKDEPWTYKAGEKEKTQRIQILEKHAKMSPRYMSLRKRLLTPILAKIDNKLTDNEIELLIRSKKDASILLALEKSQKNRLRKIKEGVQLELIIKSYTDLQDIYRNEFDTKIKMFVFDHSKGFKEVEMSPMDSIKYHLKLLQTGLVAMDPKTGHVKCWNGGLDFNYFKYDHVLSRRSIGSTAKPFLYTLAMSQKGIKPCQEYKDMPYSILPGEGDFKNKEPWNPENATKVNTGLMYNLYHGLLYSKNTITVKLLKELGSVKPLINMWDQMGIPKDEKLPNGRLAVEEWPSIALGAIDISLLQLTAAYATFANQGNYTKPILVKTIKDKTGKIIYQAKTETQKVIAPLYNAIMLDMLINNESGDFTMNLKSPNGGKTGTTDDQSDGWFVGLTPGLVVGIWTGGEEKWIRFLRDDVGQGYFTARPVFEKFIKKLEADQTGLYDVNAQFAAPPPGFQELTNCSKRKTEKLADFLNTRKPLDSLSMKPIGTDTLRSQSN